MSLHWLVLWLALAFGASIVGIVAGAAHGSGALLSAWGALFALAILAGAVIVNRGFWAAPSTTRVTSAEGVAGAVSLSAAGNARLLAIAHAWIAIAMQAVYLTPLTGLRWQHAWQYGLAFALAAGLAHLFGSSVARDTPWRAWAAEKASLFTFLHTLAAAGGLAYLLGTGKLASRRMDWAANQVFVIGALILLTLGLVSLVTLRHIEQGPGGR